VNATEDVTRLHVAVDDGAIFRVVVSNWPDGADTKDPDSVFGDYWPPLGWRMASDAESEAERTFTVDLDSPASLAAFESQFGLYVVEKIRGYVAIHAALVRIGQHVLVIPGPSGEGKSTLARTALSRGHQVLTDEFCLVESETGLVSGWPRPIRERLVGGGINRIPIDASDPVHPTHVIVTSFSGDELVKGMNLEAMTGGQVALDLLANTVCAQSRPEESFQASVMLARRVQGFAGTRGEAEEALAHLEEWLVA
jgi:hypothetical protein